MNITHENVQMALKLFEKYPSIKKVTTRDSHVNSSDNTRTMQNAMTIYIGKEGKEEAQKVIEINLDTGEVDCGFVYSLQPNDLV